MAHWDCFFVLFLSFSWRMAGSRYPMERITCGSGALVGEVSMPHPGQVPMFRYSGSMARNGRVHGIARAENETGYKKYLKVVIGIRTLRLDCSSARRLRLWHLDPWRIYFINLHNLSAATMGNVTLAPSICTNQ